MVVVVVVVNFKFVWRQPVVVLEVIVNLYLVMKVGRARGDGEMKMLVIMDLLLAEDKDW